MTSDQFPNLPLTDTHCHLMLSAFDKDRDATLERALQAGVRRILLPGIDLETSRKAVALAERHPALYAAVGLHPHRAKTWSKSMQRELKALAHAPSVVAIGEIGLDFYRNLSPSEVQRTTFQDLLDLALEVDLPVVVHSREATEAVLEHVLAWSAQLPAERAQRAGVLHAYSGEGDAATKAIAGGFYIGVAGPVTYKRAKGYNHVYRQLPPERLLVETDAPYLTPHPRRSQRNEPALVRLVAEGLSQVLGKDLGWTCRRTTNNAATLFGWNDDFADSADI